MPSPLILIVPAVILMVIGTRIRPRGVSGYWEFPWGPAAAATPVGKTFFAVGLIGAAVGLYAGFNGPVRVGSLTLPAFNTNIVSDMVNEPLKKIPVNEEAKPPPLKKEYENALAYAHDNIQVDGGYRDLNGLAFKGRIRNAGDRKISYIVMEAHGFGSETERIRIDGPFLPGAAAKEVTEHISKNFMSVENRVLIVDARY